jgi:hypothetical protein
MDFLFDCDSEFVVDVGMSGESFDQFSPGISRSYYRIALVAEPSNLIRMVLDVDVCPKIANIG